jgi:glycosyltransferase involved in cell wall biosynthesis
MSQPLVSAIISTYNSEKFIIGRIENLLNQTISDQLEIIIVNSGSEENECDVITEFLEKYHQIEYIETEERETIYKAWNRGIKLASGKYITNANTDDRLRSDALEILTNRLDKYEDVALVYANQFISNIPNQAYDKVKTRNRFKRLNYSRIRLLSGYVAGPQSVWRASLHFEDDIWFNEEFEVGGDYDFVCRVAEIYPLLKVPGTLGVYFKSDENKNKELMNIDLTKEETFQIQDKYLRRYLDSLSAKDFETFNLRIKFFSRIPGVIFSAIRKFLETVLPSYQIPSRAFFYWVASIIEETKGNINKATGYCNKYEKTPSYLNIIRQSEKLDKKSS